jgi:hypothetical protein
MKQKLITLSSPVAVRDASTKQTYLVNVVEGVAHPHRFQDMRLLRIHKVYDAAAKQMQLLNETVSLEVKHSNIRSIQEL